MTTYTAHPASAQAYGLGEGPVWDAARGRVIWVDIPGGAVLEGELRGDQVEVTAEHAFAGTVGAAVPAADGRLLVAGQERLVVLAPSGERTLGTRVVVAGHASRTNDGAVDPAGRLLIGTLALADDDGAPPHERLLRVEDDGRLTVIDDDLTLSNGLAWSADGSTLYSIDTLARRVWARDYDAATGAVGERREHLRVTGGLPDGLCADTAGNLWIAIWGDGEVRRYAPDGTIRDVVRVDAPLTSSVAFVGPGRDLLLITTARDELAPAELAEHPDSGRLFSVRVDAVGVPTTAWSGVGA
ncbi:SMP-30/gluconolactonase/LRE family protein [Pengzhenrongella sicca]|uniref:SMP-30/gluconolactonase/LRE family protein n=1 Tax=Pengzhenrongella sicca TaxID=2819238 RepID=A0A8A4ZEY3_9MICO|nr:SMP-30/gluconolactonase/LRE family protein [Pengzhenrongella sicca]QTE28258.1 SMP-30/gluconolactonase/LRE family protein [Pengzhenrongella sicca]